MIVVIVLMCTVSVIGVSRLTLSDLETLNSDINDEEKAEVEQRLSHVPILCAIVITIFNVLAKYAVMKLGKSSRCETYQDDIQDRTNTVVAIKFTNSVFAPLVAFTLT